MEMSISTLNTGNTVWRRYTNAIVSACYVKYNVKCEEAKKVCLRRRKRVMVGSYLSNKEVQEVNTKSEFRNKS